MQDTITSGGFCTCYIVGIYDNVRRHAYLLHDEAPLRDKILPQFIEHVLAHSNPENLRIEIMGGGTMEPVHDDYIEDNRNYVQTEILRSIPPSRVNILWFEENEGKEMKIDPARGEFTIDDY